MPTQITVARLTDDEKAALNTAAQKQTADTLAREIKSHLTEGAAELRALAKAPEIDVAAARSLQDTLNRRAALIQALPFSSEAKDDAMREVEAAQHVLAETVEMLSN